MPPVTIKPLHPRPGSPLTLTIPAVVAGPCSYCGKVGRLRCSVCHAWYCTQHCQASHWPLHRRECVKPPHLVWPDGVRYMGEVVVMDKGEEEVVMSLTKAEADDDEEDEVADQEMMSMNTLVNVAVGKARLEQSMKEGKDKDKYKTEGQKAAVAKPVTKQNIKTATTLKVAEVPKPVQSSQAKSEDNRKQVSSPVGQSVSKTNTAQPTRQIPSNYPPPSIQDHTVTDKTTSPVTPPVQSLTPTYFPAVLSSTLPPQCPPSHLCQVVLPLADDTSPGQFGVRLLEQEDQLKMLMQKMLESAPLVVQGWKIGSRETVAVMVEEIFYRALTIRKMEEQYEVYLLDYGGLVTVGQDMMRPLPAEFAVLPAFNYQVCLAVVGHRVGEVGEVEELMKGVLNNDMEYKLGVEFVGEVLGGRWAVKLRGIEDNEDAGQLLLGSDVAVARDDDIVKTVETVRSATEKSADQTPNNSDSKSPLHQPTEVPVVVSVPRGVLPTGSDVKAVVCHLDTPSSLYICPITSVDQFTNILTLSQDCPPGQVVPAVGNCCLAEDDDCWYRAEIVELSQDQALVTVFLLDYGKTVQATLAMLRPLPEVLGTVDGLVCKVSLQGIKAAGKEWSKDEIDGAGIILDAGNDVTQFQVTVVKVNSKVEVVVTMRDMENNDVASLMVKTGIAVLGEQSADSSTVGYRPGCLSQGVHTVIMLRMVSPMEMYVCSQEMFLQLSTSIAMLEEVAAKTAHVDSVKIDDPVIACDDGTWYRAKVAKVMSNNMVQVELVDLASQSTLLKNQLRQASPDIMKDDVMAVSCCLDSWVGEDRDVAKEKWGHKMSSLVDDYDELEVEVVGQEGGQCRVNIPVFEKKLKGESKSVAEMFKERLRKK